MIQETMRYPFAVAIVYGGFRTTKYARTTLEAEAALVDALRKGADTVHVDYLRRPIGLFTPADLRTIVAGDASTFLARRLESAVLQLGPNPTPLPRGRKRQAVFQILQELGLDEATARRGVRALAAYMK